MTADQFSVLFQVTSQFAELPPDRWRDRDVEPADPAALATVVRSARDLIRSQGVAWRGRVLIEQGAGPDPAGCRAFLVERADGDGPSPDIRIEVPRRLARAWPALLDSVRAALGDTELYYRTGYRTPAVEEAVSALCRISS